MARTLTKREVASMVLDPVPTPDFSGERQLHAKLAWVMGQVGYIERKGKNPHFGYRFVRETDLKERLGPLLSNLRISMIPQVLEHERVARTKSDLTILTVRWLLIDGDTGESEAAVTIGYGDDSGDKGANKAMTAALKYFLISTFLVVTGDDPEEDAAADRRGTEREQATSQNITITPSDVKARRGGHSDQATSTQLNEVSTLSRAMGLGPDGVRDIVRSELGTEWTLPESEDEAIRNRALAQLLMTLTGEEIGRVIARLRHQAELLADLPTSDQLDLPEIPM